GEYPLLDGHEQIVLGGQLGGERDVDRLGEAGVGDGDRDAVLGEDVGGLERLLHAGSIAEQRDPRGGGARAGGLTQNLSASDLDRLGRRRQLVPDPGTARVTQRDRPVVV